MLRDKKFWIGIVVSLFFLFLAFRGEDPQAILNSLLEANYWAIIPALIFYFIGVWIRALRWQVLLSPLAGRLPLRRLFDVVAIGYMANNVLPARLGEVVRAYVLSRRENVTKSATLATILVERIFDGLTMIGFLAVAALFISVTQDIENILRIGTILFVVGLLVFIALAASPDRITTLVQFLLGRSPLGALVPVSLHERAEQMTNSVVSGFGVLRSWSGVSSVLGLSVLAWGFETAMYWMIGAYGFGFNLPIHAYALTCAVANLATLIPSTPGYVGVFEGAVKLVLIPIFKIATNEASTFAILLHAALYIPITLLGAFYMIRLSVSWNELAGLEKKEASGEPGVASDDSALADSGPPVKG